MSDRPPPHHHPPEALLVDHAAGQLDFARRVTVEAHLAYCAACRRALAGWTAPGATLLEGGDAEDVAEASWQALEGRLDSLERDDDTPPFGAPPPLPPGLRGHLPSKLFGGPWRRVPLSSARFTVVHDDSQSGATLLLLHIGPDRCFPRHRHLGCEDVVVLEGAFRDPSGLYRPGDFQLSEPGTEHRPEVQPGASCWVLTRFEAGIRFAGVRGLLQRLAR